MRISVFSAALVAALVGIAGALAVVLAATDAVGATPAQQASWVTGLLLAMAITSPLLSLAHRIPIITAWSTPGAAVIAATAGSVRFEAAVGAFLLAALLILLTALVRPLGRLIERIPMPIAAAMLAGVLLRFVVAMADGLNEAPLLVLPLIALFLLLRRLAPSLVMMAVIAAGIGLAQLMGLLDRLPSRLELTTVVLVTPELDPAVLIGLGVPLYIVTMASQNLPGAAVLRAAGYPVPMASILAATGLASAVTALIGAHTNNLAAITAAICIGPEAHPDRDRRWLTGLAYGVIYLVLAAFGASLVALFAAFPAPLLKAVAGLGLIGSLTGALATALGDERGRFPAVLTFAITASGLAAFGIGSAFWGLIGGLVALAFEAAADRLRRQPASRP
jgi:benzoate membrane transport protein